MQSIITRPREHPSTGFTLVEVMIVVVLMAILAAIALPQFSSSANAARESAAKFNLQSLRAQIQLYKTQHDGRLPTSGLPELMIKTNGLGATTGDTPYGPYANAIPANPYNHSATVVDTTGNPPSATVAGAGWLYNPTTGGLWINDTTVPFTQQ